MRRPKAPRRGRAGAVDRRTAAAAFSLAAVALLSTAGVVRSRLPGRERNDPIAARDLVARLRAGERGSWLARYDFTRTLANGRVLHQSMSEARDASFHVLISGSAMTFERDGRDYDCTLLDVGSSCTGSSGSGALPASEVLRVAIAAGAYAVTRAPPLTIAGSQARCFRVLTTAHGQLSDLGVETDSCVTAGGVSLRQRVVHSTGDVDERVARSVSQPVTDRMIDALGRSFDPNIAVTRR